jgi:flavin reductase (DIM6/NTAB) family NADH-FMN oxidoreductase RutF
MKNITSLDPKNLSTVEVHKILLTAVAPRPIAFASTIDTQGNVNLSPFSFFNVFSANPPIMIFSPARRVRDNTTKHTLENIKKVKEVVINTVNFSIVEQMSLTSTEYDQDINEFEKSGLTQVPSTKIKPPRVAESPVSFECVVDDIIALGDQGGAGNLVIARVVYIHINNDYLDESGKLDTKKLDLVARLGSSWYSRVTAASLFEIPKPISTKGIGVDQLPKHLFETDIISKNEIGRLGNSEKIPTDEELVEFKTLVDVKNALQPSDRAKRIQNLHFLAKSYLKSHKIEHALKTIFSLK